MILVTGSTGFVGNAVVNRLRKIELPFVCATRSDLRHRDAIAIGDIGPATDWSRGLKGCSTVIHLAAYAHGPTRFSNEHPSLIQHTNVYGTENLARQAHDAGVKRFVFISSIKVNGEATKYGSPFRPEDVPRPLDAYGHSKFEAEALLREKYSKSAMEVVVIRPVLAYGPGVKANFLAILKWIKSGIPIPFGGICNRRSLISVDNLADLIVRCAFHPAAANQVFLASDGEDLSTPELFQRTATALGLRANLFSIPLPILRMGGKITGNVVRLQKLVESLQVDIDKTCRLLDWKPPQSVSEGLALTAEHFLRTSR